MNQYGGAGGSGSGVAKKRDPQSLTRLTIKQCNEAVEAGGKYIVDGRPIQQVHLIANVLTVSFKETNVELSVEDGSGTITVRLYLDGNEGDSLQSIKEGEYRMIVGTLKKIGGSLCVIAFTLAPIEDHNMLTMHLLDTILTHQRTTLGPASSAMKQQNGGGFAKQENGAPGGMQVDYSNGGMMNGGGVGSSNGVGGSSLKEQVLWYFAHGEGSESDAGCSISKVASQLSSYTHLQIQEAVVQLSDDGHIYSTIDDEHFKTTTS